MPLMIIVIRLLGIELMSPITQFLIVVTDDRC